MMIPINVVTEILKSALDFTSNIVSKFDDEKYAKAVTVIYGHEPDYKELDDLAELIKADPNTSINDKRDLLFSIADKKSEMRQKEIENKRESAKIVTKGFEKKCKFAGKLFLGVATGGLSCIPDLYRMIQDGMSG